MRHLIGRGANVGAVDDNGLGPLHYAAMRDRSEVAALLLASGADPLLRDDTEFGYTPLHVCVHYDARATLATLLAHERAKAGIDTVYVRGWGLVGLVRLGIMYGQPTHPHTYTPTNPLVNHVQGLPGRVFAPDALRRARVQGGGRHAPPGT